MFLDPVLGQLVHDLGRFLGCYGVSTVGSPALDALAAEGVRFDRAFCTAPQCSPSRAALFTGRYPHSTGVMGLTHHRWDFNPTERHLASLLRGAGYDTELVGIHHESAQLGDDEVAARLGFHRVDTLREGGHNHHADAVADRAVASLRARAGDRDRPFYLQVGFFEPHRQGGSSFDGVAMGFVGDYIEPDAHLGVTVPSYLRDDDDGRAEVAELQGAVRHMDTAVGKVLLALDELGLADDTIVVFTTDHGLALPRAKCSLYDPGLETALLLRAPRLGWSGGRVSTGLVSNVDIVPTLLDAVGCATPANTHGRSFFTDLAGGSHEYRPMVFGELTFHNYYDPRRCVRTDSHKLIVNFEHSLAHAGAVTQSWRPRSTPLAGHMGWPTTALELYDLASDPLELTNIADIPDHADTVTDLRRALSTWMHETDDPLLNGPVSSPNYDHARRTLIG